MRKRSFLRLFFRICLSHKEVLMQDLLLDLVDYLVENGIAEGDGVDCFRDFEPEDPDDVITLYEYQGDPAVPFEEMLNRSVQVTTRSLDAEAARRKALDIYAALRKDNRVVYLTPDRLCLVYLRQTPFKLKVDSKERVTYAFNIGVTTISD